MKKTTAVFLGALILLTAAACSNEQQNSAQTDYSQSTASAQGEKTEAEASEEADTAIFAATEGTWLLDGEENSASIYMDGEGGFIARYASGFTEAAGYLEYVDENGSGRYDMYDGELGLINSFSFDSKTQLRMGGDSGNVYVKAVTD